MRVTMVNKYYPPHIGGIEFHVRDLAEGLAKRDDITVRAIVANEASSTVRETIDGVDVTRLARAFSFSSTPVAPGMAAALAGEAAREDRADVLHLHFPYPWGDLSWLMSRPGLPTVLSYHSDIVRQKTLLRFYRPILDRVLDAVDLIVAGSPVMVEMSPFLAPRAAKCRVVPYGLPVERFDATPDTLARAASLRQGHRRPIVLFVGRLIYYKGVDVLIRALRSVDADAVLIGRGPLEGELRELAVALGVNDRVTFLAPASDEELAAWYHAADVFCLPSTEPSEAFGLVQIEAHAAGTPVVSTDLPTGVRFANLHERTGLTVAVGDPTALAEGLNRLLGDDALRERLGRQASERAFSEFSVACMVSKMEAVYEEAIALHRGARAAGNG